MDLGDVSLLSQEPTSIIADCARQLTRVDVLNQLGIPGAVLRGWDTWSAWKYPARG